MSEQGFDCALHFDNPSLDFVLGCEVGRLWEQLKDGGEVVQEAHATNAEMMIRLAEAMGREFSATEEIDGWIEVTFAPVPSQEDGS